MARLQGDLRSSAGPPRVGVFVETSSGAGRDILCGIARYVRENGPWAVQLDPRDQIFDPNWMPLWLDGWRGNGLIGRLQSPALTAAFIAANVPAVDVLAESGFDVLPANSPQRSHFPIVHLEESGIARMAADHLLERGFQRFAFVGIQGVASSARRREAFIHAVQERGHNCDVLETRGGMWPDESWDRFIDEAAEWLRRSPKPLGVMLAGDEIGPQVAQACRKAGVPVPEDVALVGVNNDEPICLICDPPLSSVDPNHEEVGYRAAALLDRMMSGDKPPAAPILVQPLRVVARRSSESSAIEDAVVSAALSLIREGACEGLQAGALAAKVGVSRSVLQRRFRSIMGRSVHEEIVRVQLQRAQELLRQSSLSLRTVAERTGFKHQEYMGAVFKARLGVTPGEFRKHLRQGEKV